MGKRFVPARSVGDTPRSVCSKAGNIGVLSEPRVSAQAAKQDNPALPCRWPWPWPWPLPGKVSATFWGAAGEQWEWGTVATPPGPVVTPRRLRAALAIGAPAPPPLASLRPPRVPRHHELALQEEKQRQIQPQGADPEVSGAGGQGRGPLGSNPDCVGDPRSGARSAAAGRTRGHRVSGNLSGLRQIWGRRTEIGTCFLQS